MRKIWMVVLTIFILASLFLRFYHLDSTPPFVGPDEIQYLSEATALISSGRDITHTWSPWQLTSSDQWYSELPGTLETPAVFSLRSHPILAARLTHVVLGSIFPFILGAIAYSLFRRKSLAVIVIILSTVNPWLFQYSRLSFESYFSLFLYSLGIWIYITFTGRRRLWSILPFSLGFFQYSGHKAILFPLILVLFLYNIFSKKTVSSKYSNLLVLVSAAILVLVFIIRLPSQSAGSRAQEQLSFLNLSNYSRSVDRDRRLTLSNSLTGLFSNKFTAYTSESIEKYLTSFNPVYFFLRNPFSPDSWSVKNQGALYLLDLPLILIGIFYLIRRKSAPQVFLLVSLLLISPLPSLLAVGDLWPTYRNSLAIITLVILAGYGLDSLLSGLNKVKYLILVLFYAIGPLFFFYNYFYTYPVNSTGDVFFYSRVVASYIKRINVSQPILIYATEPKHFFESLLYYNQILNTHTYPGISAAVRGGNYSWSNITVTSDCNFSLPNHPTPVIFIQNKVANCAITGLTAPGSPKIINLASLIDSGSVFKIYGDQLCSVRKLPGFINITSVRQLNLEQLSDSEFCSAYFVDYRR